MEIDRKRELWNRPNISGDKCTISFSFPLPFIINTTFLRPPGYLQALSSLRRHTGSLLNWHSEGRMAFFAIPLQLTQSVDGRMSVLQGQQCPLLPLLSPTTLARLLEKPSASCAPFPLLSPPHSCWISHSSKHSPESASLSTSQREDTPRKWGINGLWIRR